MQVVAKMSHPLCQSYCSTAMTKPADCIFFLLCSVYLLPKKSLIKIASNRCSSPKPSAIRFHLTKVKVSKSLCMGTFFNKNLVKFCMIKYRWQTVLREKKKINLDHQNVPIHHQIFEHDSCMTVSHAKKEYMKQ